MVARSKGERIGQNVALFVLAGVGIFLALVFTGVVKL